MLIQFNLFSDYLKMAGDKLHPEEINLWRATVDLTPCSPSPIGGPEFSGTMEMAVGRTVLINSDDLLIPLFKAEETMLKFIKCDSFSGVRFNSLLGDLKTGDQLHKLLKKLPRHAFIHLSIPEQIFKKYDALFRRFNLNPVDRYPYYVVDLPASYDEWFNRPGICRGNIRRAQKSGVKIEFGGQELLNDFYSMYQHSYKRWREQNRSYTAHNFERFKRIFDLHGSKARVALAKHDDKTVASAIFIAYETIGATVSAGIDYRFQKMRPVNLLHSEIIKCLIEKKVKKYHLGGEIGGEKLGRFKKTLGAKKYTSLVLARHRYPKSNRIVSLIKRQKMETILKIVSI